MSKILIIDDNQDNVLVLRMLLEDYEIFDVISILDATHATQTVNDNDDLIAIFLDLSMPISGFNIFEQIKHHDIPVFAYSVYSNYEEKALKQGFSGFLEKPIKEKNLKKILTSLGYQWTDD